MTKTEIKEMQRQQLDDRLREQRRPREEARRLAEIHAAKPITEKLGIWWANKGHTWPLQFWKLLVFVASVMVFTPFAVITGVFLMLISPFRVWRMNREMVRLKV